ncbi:MAG: hypothetical protein QOE07_2300 [Acidimicrobiaceae bacterium]|jgi:hypothetical protein|nr:hypothetical protein [Acidimicrobiaceae bacterium]MDQ1413712.1 hypothetical protein [Acidimicrobiaceae bacterium]MDQ1417774.1 hypothetical protein [Acidimicrobiaceae bacterium]
MTAAPSTFMAVLDKKLAGWEHMKATILPKSAESPSWAASPPSCFIRSVA